MDQGKQHLFVKTSCFIFTLWFTIHTLHATEQATGGFNFANFQSTAGLRLVGSAERSGKVLRVTPAKNDRHGGVWHIAKQPVGGGFESVFEFQFTDNGGLGRGADGLAFVLQNSGSNALAGKGSSGGFAMGDGSGDRNSPGIPSSIAVFFDTFRNEEEDDPNNNYLAICTNGKIGEMKWPPARLAMQKRLPFNMKDNKVHRARISYQPPVLSVYLDDRTQPVLSTTVDVSPVVDADGNAWVGFTASTGGGFENHDVLSWSFRGQPFTTTSTMVTSEIQFHRAECMPRKNLCTVERASVQELAPGVYHVVLPAHLAWSAAIPNTQSRNVTIHDARGIVCWDAQARGSAGCSGPSSDVLQQRTEDGKTHFSIHDPSGSFADNEGFFEFEVRVQP